MLVHRTKPLNKLEKVVCDHLKKNVDDFSHVKVMRVYGDTYRVNFFEKKPDSEDERIKESYFIKIVNNEVINCIKD